MQRRLALIFLFCVASLLSYAMPANAGLFGRRHAATPSATPSSNASAVSADTHTVAAARADVYVLIAINLERKRMRAAPLALDERISSVAQAYAFDMARRNFFSHVSPDGDDPFMRMQRVGITFHAAGENIGEADNLVTAERAIYGSPEHRAIVLGPRFRHVGLGSVQTRDGVLLVEDFTD